MLERYAQNMPTSIKKTSHKEDTNELNKKAASPKQAKVGGLQENLNLSRYKLYKKGSQMDLKIVGLGKSKKEAPKSNWMKALQKYIPASIQENIKIEEKCHSTSASTLTLLSSKIPPTTNICKNLKRHAKIQEIRKTTNYNDLLNIIQEAKKRRISQMELNHRSL